MHSHIVSFFSTAFLCLSFFLFAEQCNATSINYCHDQQTNQDWERLAHQNSEPEIKELYTLRKELCRKIDDGVIGLDAAIDIFEEQRQIKIKSIFQRKMKINNAASPG